jgi:hypothetical protein
VAISIVETAGSATANSFVSEAEFIAYLATVLNTYTGATVTGSTCTENEEKALIEAFRWLNNVGWQGTRTDGVQSGAWPRMWVTDPDAPAPTEVTDIQQLYFDDDEIPARVKRGQMALAHEFLLAGATDIARMDPTIGVIEKTVDVLTTRYAEPYQRAQGLARFPKVTDEIAPLLAGAAGGLDLERV